MNEQDFEHLGMFLQSELDDPTSVRKWNAYSYHHIDILVGMPKARDVLFDSQGGFELMQEIMALFRRAGWEGDGMIQIMWLPPFLFDDGDTWGEVCFHVKQSNNGTSWIASKKRLPFRSLELENSTHKSRG